VMGSGGGRGIRTPERVTPLTVFKTAAFNHSAIPPSSILPDSPHALEPWIFVCDPLALNIEEAITVV
jgi:hypothetical protein